MALGVFVVETARPRRKLHAMLTLSAAGTEEKEDCRSIAAAVCVQNVLSCAMSVNRLMRLHAAQGQPRAVKTRFRVRTTAIKVHLARCRPMRVGLKWVRPVQIRDPRRCAPPQS